MRLPVQQSLNSDRYKVTPIESGNFFSPTLGIEPESCQDDGIGRPKRLKNVLSICGIVLAVVVFLLLGISIFLDYGTLLIPIR